MSHILSLSYGKDSLACIHVIKDVLGWPLDRIVHAEVWATDTIPAELPPMVEFKAKADAVIKERWGVEVERYCAMSKEGERLTYEKLFYHVPQRKQKNAEKFGGGDKDSLSRQPHGATVVSNYVRYGFPIKVSAWCHKLKYGTYIRIPGFSTQRKLVYQPQEASFLPAP